MCSQKLLFFSFRLTHKVQFVVRQCVVQFLTCDGECCWFATACVAWALLHNIVIKLGTELDYIITIWKGCGLGNVRCEQHIPIEGSRGAVFIFWEVLLIDNHQYLGVIGISSNLPLHGNTEVFIGQLALRQDHWQGNDFCTKRKKERHFCNATWNTFIVDFIQRCITLSLD